jgi:hypothetical protein
VPKLMWRVKLVAEFETGEATEVEVARLERDERAGLADLGLCLAEAKRLIAAIQAEMGRGSKSAIFRLHGRAEAAGFRGQISTAILAGAGGSQPPQIRRVGVEAVRDPAASANADGLGRSSLRAGFCLDVPRIGCA